MFGVEGKERGSRTLFHLTCILLSFSKIRVEINYTGRQYSYRTIINLSNVKIYRSGVKGRTSRVWKSAREREVGDVILPDEGAVLLEENDTLHRSLSCRKPP